MEIQAIKSERDYRAALQQVEALMDADSGTPDGDKLDVLATLISAYEACHYPMNAASPVEAIKFNMDQKGLQRDDLQAILGNLCDAQALLDGTLQLTLPIIWRLHTDLGIPAELLIRPTDGEAAVA
jgi:HTH-type transcriptional regulator/antitoxin HigA